jgi:hypothetical protein
MKRHLRIVLQTLREHQLYAKFNKCDFYQKKIQYLGHIISEDGISVDPEKIKEIVEWPRPTNVAEIRSFMGITGYYRRFIEIFQKILFLLHLYRKRG